MVPCPQKSLETICCALNRTIPSGGDTANGDARDECMPNGLCLSKYLSEGYTRQSYWRNYCTEKDWSSGKCLNVCAENKLGGTAVRNAPLVPCDGTANSTRWCCGESCSCDDETNVVSLPAIFGQPLVTNSVSLPTSSSTTSSPTASATNVNGNTNQNSENKGLSTGAKAGIGVAAAIGALVLLGLGLFAMKALQWRKKAAVVQQSSAPEWKYSHTAPTVFHELPPAPPAELVSREEIPHEM